MDRSGRSLNTKSSGTRPGFPSVDETMKRWRENQDTYSDVMIFHDISMVKKEINTMDFH